MRTHLLPTRPALLSLGTLLLPLWIGAGRQAPTSVDTGFIPSRDMPATPNRTGRFNAMNGECNGMDELAQSYYRWRKQYPNAPGLAQATETVRAGRGQNYLNTVMDLATEKSLTAGQPRYEPSFASRNPAGFERRLVERMTSTGEPQSVILTPGTQGGVAHRVTVYGAEKITTQQGERWALKVADSNAYGVGDVDKARLVFEPGEHGAPGRWAEYVDGKPVAHWRGGDLVHGTVDRPSVYVDLMTQSMQGRPLGEIRTNLGITQEPPLHRASPPGSATAVKDPKVEGVLVQFDPALFTGEATEEELHGLEARYEAFLNREGAGAALFRLRPETLDLRLVPLAALTARGATTVGGLTRVRGFVRARSGELYLVGQCEAGRKPIPLGDLVVALRCAYAGTRAPFVSLDPDPTRPGGPQKVRVGDLPEGLRATGYVRAMLDADYLMKRINLGRVKPALEGFQRWVDILAESGAGAQQGGNRMWLAPLSSPAGDVLVYRNGGAQAVLFESHVQVLSEEMKLLEDASVGVGASSPDAEAAATQYTRRFDELAGEYPEFARLKGIFDVTKLAVSLRAFGVRSSSLDAVAAGVPGAATVPASYEGIGPDTIGDGRLVVSGGATSGCRIYSRAAIATDCLRPLTEAAGHARAATVTIPAEFDVDAALALGFQAEAYAARARQAQEAGDFEEVVDRASAVLALDPDHPEALRLRSAAFAVLGRLREALVDCDRLVRQRPAARAFRALLRARRGDVAGARQDIRQAQRLAPDSDDVKLLVVLADMQALDLPAARAAAARLAAAVPAHPMLASLRMQIGNLERRSRADARRYLRLASELPPRIGAAFAYAARNGEAPERAISRLEEALLLAESGEYSVPDGLQVPYRLRCALILAYAAQAERMPEQRDAALDRGAALYEHLAARQADRGLPHVLRAYLGAAGGEDTAALAGYLRLAADRNLTADPVYPDMQWGLGTGYVVEAAAAELWAKCSDASRPAEELLDLVARRADRRDAALLQQLRGDAGPAVAKLLREGFGDIDHDAKEQLARALIRVTMAAPSRMADDDPLFAMVSRLYACQAVLLAQLEERQAFRETAFRALGFLRRTRPGLSPGSGPGRLVALVWSLLGALEFEDPLLRNRPLLDAFDRQDERLRAALHASPVRLSDAGPAMAELARSAGPLFRRIGAEYARGMANIEEHCGPLTRVAVELVAALIQESPGRRAGPSQDVRRLCPALAQTGGFARLVRAERRADTMLTPRRASQLWRELLGLCASSGECDAAAGYARVLREMCAQGGLSRLKMTASLDATLRRWEAQALVRGSQL